MEYEVPILHYVALLPSAATSQEGPETEKKWNISMILQYHPSVPPPYLLHQWTSSNIHSQKCFTWITVPIYCLHFKKSLRHSRSLDISTKSPFKGSLFTLASQKRGTGFTSRNWNSETLGSSLVSEQESKLKFSLSDYKFQNRYQNHDFIGSLTLFFTISCAMCIYMQWR